MELQKILSISGQSGLWEYVAQSTSGVIVASLTDGHRINVPATAKVSSMAEISIFTDTADVPLAEVFAALFKHAADKPTISHKADNAVLKALFEAVLPAYDRDRFHVSDMKKVVAWYNALVEKGMTDFSLDKAEAVDAQTAK